MSRQNTTLESFESAWNRHWLPKRPLCGDVKAPDHPSLRRRSRRQALKWPHFESNPLVKCSVVVVDHDSGVAARAAQRAGLPEPSWVTCNPDTGNGHIGYALTDPVVLTNPARRGPILYLARIENSINTLLKGDIAYTGRITKNPFAPAYDTIWGTNTQGYSLGELGEALDACGALLPGDAPRTHLLRSTLGRNCGLFDAVRVWSYPRRGNHTRLSTWENVVYEHAKVINETIIATEFTAGPLSEAEVRGIAQSIARWTWRNITRTHSQEQARRGRLGSGRNGGLAGGWIGDSRPGGLANRNQLITLNKTRGPRHDRATLIQAATDGR